MPPPICRPLLILTALLGLICLPACSDEEGGELPPPVVQVFQVPGYEAVAQVKVVVMDPATNTPAAMPAISDQAGNCTFPDLQNGVFNLVAFGGSAYRVIDLPGTWQVSWRTGKGMVNGLTGLDQNDPLPPAPVVQVALWDHPGELPRISGQVVDALTGQPLGAAFVSTSPFLAGYVGGTTFKDDVTLADGLFSVSEIAFAQDPDTGNLLQIEPLLVTCAGYRSRSWKHQPAHGDDNLDISGVSIALDPIGSTPTGALSGRLLMLGEPAAGVRVGLGSVGSDKSGVGQPGFLAWTGNDGVFRFGDLPAGSYFLQAGFLPHDGIFYPGQIGNVARTVEPGQETVAGDLEVLHEIQLNYPPNGWDYLGPEWIPELAWAPVAGAAKYGVFLDRLFLAETDTTTLDLPEDLVLAAGEHYWSVRAYDLNESVIGATEVPGIFYIIATP